VQYPSDDEGKAAVIPGFQEFIDGLPQCAGAVDGCMIQMPKPATKQCPPDLKAGGGYDISRAE
jgi:hypothetical protein